MHNPRLMRGWQLLQGAGRRAIPGGFVGSIPQGITDFLFPPICPVTEQRVNQHGAFSPEGWQKLSFLAPPWCPACGLPYDDDLLGGTHLCGACAAPNPIEPHFIGPRALDRFRAAFAYDDVIAGPLLRLKYADRTDALAAFGAVLAAVARPITTPDSLVIPVPLHTTRLRRRRYNQAHLLAKAMVEHLPGHQRSHEGIIRRTKATVGQKGASRRARAANVSGAFMVPAPEQVAGRDILIVDDVLTTGATLAACAKTLRRAGAASVVGVALARVIKSHNALGEVGEEWDRAHQTA